MRCRLSADETAEVSSEAEFERLVARCTELAARDPFVVECTADTGDVLLVGFGSDACVLSHTLGSLEPPYLMSVGGEVGNEVLTYLMDDEPTEFDRRNAVSPSLAIRALRDFWRTSEPSKEVTWEEV